MSMSVATLAQFTKHHALKPEASSVVARVVSRLQCCLKKVHAPTAANRDFSKSFAKVLWSAGKLNKWKGDFICGL